MERSTIYIKGARVHNLKNIDLTLPKNKMIVITGLSGSGKSSLAFDTLYAEGQRRYVESLSAYARQFIGMMEKPDVDYIEGLSPAISIDQKTGSKNPRSTVGTMTEIYDYLRLFMARVGQAHCPKCGKEIQKQTVQQMVDTLMSDYPDFRATILGAVARHRKGEYKEVIEKMRKSGYTKMRIDGLMVDLDQPIKLTKTERHTLEVVVDRVLINNESKTRLADSLETALKLGEGVLKVLTQKQKDDEPDELTFSENFACPDCNVAIEEIEPRLFSFNSPYGACPVCDGLGRKLEVSESLVVPDPTLSIDQGAIKAPGFSSTDGYSIQIIKQVAANLGADVTKSWKDLPENIRHEILHGGAKKRIKIAVTNDRGTYQYNITFEGVITSIERRHKQTSSDYARQAYEELMVEVPCPACGGARLKPEALAVKVSKKNVAEISAMSIDRCFNFFDTLKLSEKNMMIARQVLKEIKSRLTFLLDVGLGYLSLERGSATLSGGEAQRLRLATQIGSGLGGVLYVLDEPSIGLHPKDNSKLLTTLKKLRDLGNTLVVVEHDEETMREADFICDVGPEAGLNGGHIVATGSIEDICKVPESYTGQYLSGKRFIEIPKVRREGDGRFLRIIEPTEHNLKGDDVEIPLGVLTVVTGVSGSGKSTLVNDILYNRLARELYSSREIPGKCERIEGIRNLDKIVIVDQSPIGRTPRSNPATYTGLFTYIRDLYAKLPESKARGYEPGRFSFNVKGGRCEACEGDGMIKIEMQFLPDVYVPCEVCKGKRFNRETLEIKFKGKNIAELLELNVDEALELLANIPSIRNKLQMLQDVGLGYVKLGQSATTLSGGEAQRVKLSSELSKRGNGRTLYILDEPTTGLHMADTHRLIEVLDRLVEKGNSVLVIEHNMDVIKSADYVIDLGPDGGDAGGRLIAYGAPEEVAAVEKSYTGEYLRAILPKSSIGKVKRKKSEYIYQNVAEVQESEPKPRRGRKFVDEDMDDEISKEFIEELTLE